MGEMAPKFSLRERELMYKKTMTRISGKKITKRVIVWRWSISFVSFIYLKKGLVFIIFIFSIRKRFHTVLFRERFPNYTLQITTHSNSIINCTAQILLFTSPLLGKPTPLLFYFLLHICEGLDYGLDSVFKLNTGHIFIKSLHFPLFAFLHIAKCRKLKKL